MFGTEWPLVIFTILVQMSVGLLIVSELACLTGGAAARDLLKGREFFSLVLGVAGLLFSFGHLGTPTHSPFAILNLAHSWLSREILCTSAFLGCLVVLTITRHIVLFRAFSRLVAAVAGLLGLATIFVMSRVYMIVTVPAWNSPATLLNFVGAALLLGALATGLLACSRWSGESNGEARSPIARIMSLVLLFAALGLVAKFIEIPVSLFAGLATNARGVSATSALLTDGLGPYVLQVVLLIVGTALFVHVAATVMRGNVVLLSLLGTGALFVALAGEVLGRFVFFNMHVLIGL
jgi:anaerobic dimethyl sulfoxide reductase subunit C (anchor subunit)